ncbi:hypothetical protein NFX46_23365 [Streptomyces phaeoluteigriseus]|uniref:Regulatory protein n=1 Tax=Streptomyces phaeoluteigriseus TaxID=114686 RepID=A0ABY4ZCG1_9ACTN|nr:hypothetical protein [Streptomyces phaeoluteigriseus]USQ86385.1 hypothetical protein NFX46_23365 [Streptomyces phaeoluteigriseus]
MSETTTQTNGVTSQYAAQVAGDLERNLKEYDRVAGEVAVLQEQLAALEKDRTVLMNVQQALGVESASASAAPAAVEHTAAVPAPRKKTSAGASRRSKARKSEAAPPKAAASKKAASPKTSPNASPKTSSKTSRNASPKASPEPSSKAAAKTDQPSLVSLVREHLAGQSEPRSAAEVAQSLGQQFPERGIKSTVVRTTLEALVAKNHAQRTKQGSSVFYTSPEAPAPTTSEEDTTGEAAQEGQSA